MSNTVADPDLDPELVRRVRTALQEMIPKLVPALDAVDDARSTVGDAPPTPAGVITPLRPPRGRTRVNVAAIALSAAALLGLLVAVVYRSDDPDPSPTNPTPSTAPIASVPSVPSGTPLLGTEVPGTVAPMVLPAEELWTLIYVYGSEDLPLGDLDPNRMVLVGDGPMFDAPWFQAWTTRGAGLPSDGTAVDIGGTAGRAQIDVPDGGSDDAPFVWITWPLPDGRTAHTRSSRMSQDEAVAVAESLDFSNAAPSAAIPPGFTRLDTPSTGNWLSFEYQYESGQRTLQLGGSNLAGLGLVTSGAFEETTTRVVEGVELAVSTTTEDGEHRAMWADGEWAYSLIGQGFGNEEAFLAAVADLRLVDAETFGAAATPLRPLLPGDLTDHARELQEGVALPPGTPIEQWSATAVVTTEQSFAFRLYFGIGCGWKSTWLAADDVDDTDQMATAADGVDTIAPRAVDAGVDSDMYTELASAMQAGDRTTVAKWGSNDCPTWSP